ncbi:MAG: DNA repair protein RecO [Candidatus Pacebacteria bacterium]|nr:DNA repair protein RecO [Candidatus Paceibacterota bacterium]
MRYHDRAICLRSIDYSETSQIVYFLTRTSGVVHLMAKGTKRKKSKTGGAIDMLSEGDLLYTKKDSDTLGILMEFSEGVSRSAIRRDAGRLNVALYALELVYSMLPEGLTQPEVFTLLSNTLKRLAQKDSPREAVLAWFQWRLLRHAGLLGGLDACVSCGMSVEEMAHDGEVFFTSRHGGLLCGRCLAPGGEKHQADKIVLGALAALAAAESGKKVLLPPAQAAAVTKLLDYHISHQLGKQLKMSRYVL